MKGEQRGEILSLWAEDPDKSCRCVGESRQPVHLLSDSRQAPVAKPSSSVRSSEYHREQGELQKMATKQNCIIANASSCNISPFKLPCVLTFHHFRGYWFCSIHMFWTMTISGSVLFCKFVCISTITSC